MDSERPPQTASDSDSPPYSVAEWEIGLPDTDSLPPLSQSLVPSELASAFRISPLTHRSVNDVIRATEEFFSSLREGPESIPMGCDTKQSKRIENFVEETNSGDEGEELGDKTVKRQRLVWTPQLHKRFVDVVAHLGIKNAVPKTIMQLMNVEGLTRENVASHLQKYRLYLKRMDGGLERGSGSGEGAWESNRSGNLGNERSVGVSVPMMPYGGVTGQGMIPMPMPPDYGVPNGHVTGNSNDFARYGGLEYGRMYGTEWNGYRNGSIGSSNQVKEN